MCRLCGEACPRILPPRLIVSLPVHVSFFDLNIVYTNMSGVTHDDCVLNEELIDALQQFQVVTVP